MYVESKGNFNARGASGEKGRTQLMPGRFEQISKEILGEVVPFNPLNEEYVVTKYIQKRLNAGVTPQRFALEWNAGGAAKVCSRGINSLNVAYDSCDHNRRFTLAYNNY